MSAGLHHVLKYALDPATGGQHAIPGGSRFLAAQVQGEHPVMWWSVPAEAQVPSEWPLRTFLVVPTGPPGYVEEAGLHYLATFQLGGFVGHIFLWGELDPAPREPERACPAAHDSEEDSR